MKTRAFQLPIGDKRNHLKNKQKIDGDRAHHAKFCSWLANQFLHPVRHQHPAKSQAFNELTGLGYSNFAASFAK